MDSMKKLFTASHYEPRAFELPENLNKSFISAGLGYFFEELGKTTLEFSETGQFVYAARN